MKRVLFVCVHNAGRSQMAEAFTNKMAAERAVAVSAASAGTESGKTLNLLAVEAMAEVGISLVAHALKLITVEMVKGADRIISMGCGVDADACPARFILSEDWDLEDPAGKSMVKVREIRDAIQVKVGAMLDEMARS